MRFQPGEGPSRGLLHDCETSPVAPNKKVPTAWLLLVPLSRRICGRVIREEDNFMMAEFIKTRLLGFKQPLGINCA